MRIALASSKGGAGTSTAALHLAATLAGKSGARVVLLDTDANRSATGWAARGRLPFDVRPLGASTAGADNVLIDTAGGEYADDLLDLARQCDRVVIAAQPLALDLFAALSTYRPLPEGARNDTQHKSPRVSKTRSPLTEVFLGAMRNRVWNLSYE